MHVPSLSTVRFAVLVGLVLALFTSGMVVGAAGAPLILGQLNSGSGQLTTLKSGGSQTAFQVVNPGNGRALDVSAANAVPLRIVAPSGTAPMTVNSSRRVANLNADKLDGKSASAFLPSKTYTVTASVYVAPSALAAVTASCDTGDLALGGGFYAVDLPTTHIIDNYPGGTSSWLVLAKNTGATGEYVAASALCADLGAAHVTTLSEEPPPRDE